MIDLKKVEKYRENNRIEAKKALGGLPHSIWETYSAFANTLGGVILLGVEEYRDKTFHVVDLPDPEGMISQFWSMLGDGRKVSANILTERDISIETFDGKRFIAINIPRAHRFDKPIYIDGAPFGGTYRRGGEGDYKCTAEEIEAMRRDAERSSADMTVLEDCDLSVFDDETVKKFQKRFYEYRVETVYGFDVLKKIGAICGEHPTAAGLLMLGRQEKIKERYPFFGAVYTEKNSEGEITRQIEAKNLFEFYLEAENRITRSICMLGMDRKDEIAVKDAVIEALSNSVIHADYQSNSPICVEMTPYELTVSNPGLLRVDPIRIIGGSYSDRRNSLIAKMLYLVGIGSGGVRGIYEIWKKKNWCPPSLTESFSPERVTLRLTFGSMLRNEKSEVGVTESRKTAVINYITEQIEVNSADISSLLGISRENARALLKGLAEDNILTFTKRGNTYYYMMRS